MTDKIVANNLYKIFGPMPIEALGLLEQGLDKDIMLERTGTTMGWVPPPSRSGSVRFSGLCFYPVRVSPPWYVC